MQIKEAITILKFETVKDALRSIAEYRCMQIECEDCPMNVIGKCISIKAFDLLEFLEVYNNENK